jgi:sterol desaturase/sphingolipid hydroxylase (fatty acid hydroxylase superfamily)
MIEGSLVVDLEFTKLVLVGQSCLLVPSFTTGMNSHFTEGSALYRYLMMASIFHDSTHTFLSAVVIIILVGTPIFHAFLIAGNVAENAHGVFGVLCSVLCSLCSNVWALVCSLFKALAFCIVDAGHYFSHRIEFSTGKYITLLHVTPILSNDQG